MSAMQVTVHATGSGTCSLTGKKDTEGLVVSFQDGTVKDSFLSWKAFRQLLGLKTARLQSVTKPIAEPAGNGTAVGAK